MKVIADQKRRVVLPKPCAPGDVYECVSIGDRIVLERLQKPARHVPPISDSPLNPKLLEGIDLDEPAYPPMTDEGLA